MFRRTSKHPGILGRLDVRLNVLGHVNVSWTSKRTLTYTIDSDVDNRVQLSLLPFKAITIPELTANIETFTKYPHVNQYIGYIQCLTNPLRNVLVWNIFLLVQKYELKPKLGDWV